MRAIRPIPILSSDIVSSTAVEAFADWDSMVVYADGDKVVYGDFIYESLVNSNSAQQPDISPAAWLQIAPSNTFAMFDSTVSTQTTGTSPLTVVVEINEIVNTVALLNITGATSAEVTIRNLGMSPAEEVYNQVINLDDSLVTDWYEYFFSPFEQRGDFVLTDLPPYPSVEIEVSLTGSGTVGVGVMQVGNSFEIGATQMGVNIGIRDYSIKSTDDFGNTTFVERAFSKRMSPVVFIENDRLNSVFRLLSTIRATPTVFIGTEEEGYEALIIFGFLRDWNIEITYPENSLVSLEIEGLI